MNLTKSLPATVSILIFCVVLLAGCGLLGAEEFPEAVQLRVDDESYDRGDSVTLILENGSDQKIGYNLCTSSLERRVEGSWTTVRGQAAEVCTLELRSLPPGERATYETEIPTKVSEGKPLPTGRYRYLTRIEHWNEDTRSSIVTQAFTVD